MHTKYNKIWNKVKSLTKTEFENEPKYNNKHSKTKVLSK